MVRRLLKSTVKSSRSLVALIIVSTMLTVLVGCGIILACFLVLSVIVPIVVVRKKQPRDVLKSEFRQ